MTSEAGVSHLCRCRPQCSDSAFCVTAAIRALGMFCPTGRQESLALGNLSIQRLSLLGRSWCGVEGGHHGKRFVTLEYVHNRYTRKNTSKPTPRFFQLNQTLLPSETPYSPPPTLGSSILVLTKYSGHDAFGAFCTTPPPIACFATASPRSFSISNLGSFHLITSMVSSPDGKKSAAGGGIRPKVAPPPSASRQARSSAPSLPVSAQNQPSPTIMPRPRTKTHLGNSGLVCSAMAIHAFLTQASGNTPQVSRNIARLMAMQPRPLVL